MKKYTWKPDLPDHRDFNFDRRVAALPTKVDLRNKYQLIFDQGELGSCTANSIAMGIDFERIKQNFAPIVPSRLFIYYH